MVPEIGLEPIRMLLLRILSPVRLPIPPLGHVFLLSFQFFCELFVSFFLPKILSPLRLPIPPHKHGFCRWLSVNLYSTDCITTNTPQNHTAERNTPQNLLNVKKQLTYASIQLV